jgi:curved DNA-binding protein
MDYYQILGIERTANEDEIKQAFRKLASKHHPDKGGDTQKFQEIQEAYSVLSDPQKKQQYDNPMPQGFGNGPVNINDIFANFGFNFFNGDIFQNRRKNNDIRIEIELSLQETLYDQNKNINVRLPNGQNKTFSITIPKGITSGTTIKYPHLGEKLIENVPPGDLLVTVRILKHPRFEVMGLDLVTTIKINSFDAILGCQVMVDGLDNTTYSVRIPEGCQYHTKLKIPGKGLPGFQNDIQGNLLVVVEIETAKLNEDQKTLLKQILQNN